jgi:hypothetical protein
MAKPKQHTLFKAGEELPLFCGVPVRATMPTFKPQAEAQPALFTACPICFGSGLVTVRKGKKPIKCSCQAGKS